ncbi:MAG: efflux transporter periplasmic adaptor subunit [Deltaproteobacteria bacterium RBG_16_54_11]|nr:MAG: efflux transporter periplasmic adaptor subunit [Deltaproteobacteria bacterium RBG_16_54_11]
MKGTGKLGVWIVISLLMATCACGSKKGQGPPGAIPVMADTVAQKAVPVAIHAIGNCQAYSTVAVKSMVGGEISQVHFTEGQDVGKGDLLFTIDPRPFQTALKQAEATLERDRVQAENAKINAQRYEVLIAKQAVSRQQYDQFRTNAEALEATVRVDEAAVENAKILLGYCFIRSPIDGRTGNLLVTGGNIIKANDITLITINQIRPIYVAFSVPEQNLPEIKKYRTAGKSLKVEAFLQNDATGAEQGVLTFIDNTVDKTTGTILLKGTFSNKKKRLWPGQFVNVILTLTTQPNALIVPSQAVQTGQQGQFVFVIKPDLTVEARPVVVNRTINNDAIIDQGLKAGERVVTDGQLQLVPGAKVEIKGSLNSSDKGS